MPPRKRITPGPAFTVEMPQELPVERRGPDWFVETEDGHRLKLSNLDKVFWPEEGYTKGDLLTYYFNVADRILPYLKDRPLTMKRMPNGAFGQFFYEKNAPPNTPKWMGGCSVEATGDGGRWGSPKPRDPEQQRSSRQNAPNKQFIQYLMVDDVASLLFVANMGCIEFHPLHSRCGQVETPDYLFFDLDPFDVSFETVLQVALMCKVVCDQFGLRSYPKTSGATGIQIYVPIHPDHTYSQVRDFVGRAGHMIRKVDPGRVTMEWEVRKRGGHVFIDHNMNRQGANIAAVYSVRPESGAPVSTPLTWKEVEGGKVKPQDFTITTIWKRLAKQADDPFLPVLRANQDLGPALEALGVPPEEQISDTESWVIPMPPTDDPQRAAEKEPARPSSKSADAIARSKDPKLGQYLSMRDPSATPEPMTGEPTPEGNSFVIQRHDATRLHYDLRLERDGVLVSWAVPKGLPLTKGVRHLAVHTEDHPMEYGGFEGTIPKGHYGAGDVKIWDRGTYDLVEWTDKKVSFRLHGERHHGEWHLIKTKGDDWLVLMASRSEEEPLPLAPETWTPMLAAGGYEPFTRDEWWFEPKLDGVRALLYIQGEDVKLVSRRGRDQTRSYPELRRVYRNVKATNAVLDGEIVATDETGRTSFELLQQRMNLAGDTDIERARKKIPVEMVAFDLLWLDGEPLIDRPLSERRERLEEVVHEGKGLRLMYTVPTDGVRFFGIAEQHGLEGIVGKRAASRYVPGRRSDDWRKIKILSTQDCVVLGCTPGERGRSGSFGALLLGAYKDGRLTWIGQVGTGFTDRMLKQVMEALEPLAIDHPPIDDPGLRKVKGARWVRAELVCEVEYLQMTNVGKLRAPSFKGLRPDKLPEDCVLERPAPTETAASAGPER
jgi:bifunctional non-homologous end joining protein LigD